MLEKFPTVDLESRLAGDVKKFVTASITEGHLKKQDKKTNETIENKLLSSKERRFRWAESQIFELETCHNEEQIYEALGSIPQMLEETYLKVLNGIQARDILLAREILMTICLAPELLDLNTVAAIVGLDFSESVVEICTTSLVSTFDDKVQVAHFSVQEFLIIPQEGGQHHSCQFSILSGNEFLATRTVETLLGQTEPLTRADARKLPAFLYAASRWESYVTALGDISRSNPSLQAKVDRLFTERNVYHNWIRAAGNGSSSDDIQWRRMFEECPPPIRAAACLGLAHTVETLCVPGLDSTVGLQESAVTDAVTTACIGGHLDIVQIFLRKYPLKKDSSYARSMVTTILRCISCPQTEEANSKLATILRTLWDQGVLQDNSPHLHDTIDVGNLEVATLNYFNAQIMRLFLDWQPEISVPITQRVMTLALQKPWRSDDLEKLYLARAIPVIPCILENIDRVGTELVGLLLQSHEEFRVTQKVMERAAMSKQDGNMVQFLWPYREPGVDVSKSMFEWPMWSESISQTMGFLLKQPGSSAILNEELINSHFRRPCAGLELLELISEHLEPGSFALDGYALDQLVAGSSDGFAVLKVFLSTQPGFALSDDLLRTICRHADALNMLEFLVDEGCFHITVTEELVRSASANENQGPSVIKYLEQHHQVPLPFTEDALVAASNNLVNRGEVLSILLKDTSRTSFPDEVFEAACRNHGALAILLNHQREDLPIEKMIGRIAAQERWPTDVLRILLERHIVEVDETLLETLAVNFHALHVALSWKADTLITENILSMATGSPESMRMAMDPQRNPRL
ncbi:uncharacterized protein N7506_005149 [Penicillium brevicompactum]|uniref:uncharacterized protein n=1 Tax=Penicillium brevicompactum TaxID=5074 RepID=UPI0025406CE6|nr:uncharacterized protein N7506_005149 [Penicillium brevicompactum]KAJ5337127.1 hypothetical protein N7506_005149 [Penicillium brevicompactum]